MDGCSDAETIVEESLDIYNSPSILKGLFQFRKETKTAEVNNKIGDGDNYLESSSLLSAMMASECPIDDEVKVFSAQKDEATNPDSNPDTYTDSADCQSEMSYSILTSMTSRVPEKRMYSTVSPPDSPVFAHAFSSKFPRIHNVTSSKGADESLCDDLQSSMETLHCKPSPAPSSIATCPSSQQGMLQNFVHPPIPELSQPVITPTSSKSESLVPINTLADNSESQAVTSPTHASNMSKSKSLKLEENPPINPSECQPLTIPTASKSTSLELEIDPPNPSECEAGTTPTASKNISLELEENPPNPSECEAGTTPTASKNISLELEENPLNPSECEAGTMPTASKHISLEVEENPPNPSECEAGTTPTASKNISLELEENPLNPSECEAGTMPTASKHISLELEENPPNPSECQAGTTPTASKNMSLELEENPPNPSECQAGTTPTASKNISLELEDNTINPSECQALTMPTASKSTMHELEDDPPNPSESQAVTTPTHASKSSSLELEENPPNPSECQAGTTPTASNNISLELEDNTINPSECQALTMPMTSKSTMLELEDDPPKPSESQAVTMPTHASKSSSLELDNNQSINPLECPALTTPTAFKSTMLESKDDPPNPSESQAVTTPTHACKSSSLELDDKPPDHSECQAVTTSHSRSTRLVHKDTQSEPVEQHIPTMHSPPNAKTPDWTVVPRRMPSLLPKNSQPKPSNKQLVPGTQMLPKSKARGEIFDTRSSSSHEETLAVCLSKEEDEAVIEIKKMQQDIRQRLMHNDRDKNNDVENIKKSLQDMQGKLRQLGTKQQGQRRQLSVIMRQQAASSSSSQSQLLQQQEVKAQLQNMARRQQQLLKLLQSHKDLAATLHIQYAEHRALQQQQQPTNTSQEHCNFLLDTSGVNKWTHNTIHQPEEHVSNSTHTTKMKAAAKLSSVEPDTPVVLPQSRITTASQNTCKIPPQSKETRSFKPPFKATQPLRLPPAQQNTAIILADSPSRPDPQLDKLGAGKTSSSAGFEAQSHIVSLGSDSIPPQCPPLSQSSDISNDNILPDKADNERDKTINLSGNIAHDKPSQEPTCVQIPYPHLHQSSDNIRRDNETNYGIINKDNQGSTNRAAQNLLPSTKGNPRSVAISVISNSPIGGSWNTVSKTQIGTTLSGCQSLMRGRASAAGQSLVNLKSKQQAGPPAKGIIISEKRLNILQNSRVQESTHHKNSVTTPSAITPTMTLVPVAPIRLQNTASQTQATPQEVQKVASTNPLAAAELPTVNTPVGSNMLPTAPHSGTVSASAVQSQVSMTMGLIQSTATCTLTADKSRDDQTRAGNPQGAPQTFSSTQMASLRPSIQQKEPGEDERTPSLMDLLQTKLIQPGENVLTIKGKKHILATASLNADGTVSPARSMNNFKGGSLPLMLSLVKHKSLNWINNNPKIWKNVFYKETPLVELYSDYTDLIRSDPSQTNVVRKKLLPNLLNTQAAFTTTTESNILQPPTVTTSSAHISTPPISSWQRPPEWHNRDPVSSITHDPASSSVHSLTSSHHDLAPRGHDPTGHEIHPPSGHETVSRAHDFVLRGQESVSPRSRVLVSSMNRVLLISDDELMPSSWGTSSNFWSAGNGNDTFINPEWIKDIDVWS